MPTLLQLHWPQFVPCWCQALSYLRAFALPVPTACYPLHGSPHGLLHHSGLDLKDSTLVLSKLALIHICHSLSLILLGFPSQNLQRPGIILSFYRLFALSLWLTMIAMTAVLEQVSEREDGIVCVTTDSCSAVFSLCVLGQVAWPLWTSVISSLKFRQCLPHRARLTLVSMVHVESLAWSKDSIDVKPSSSPLLEWVGVTVQLTQAWYLTEYSQQRDSFTAHWLSWLIICAQ